MTLNNKKRDILPNFKESYFTYKMLISKKKIRIYMILIGVFNLLLMIPDLSIIENPLDRICDVVLRIALSACLITMFFRIGHFKSFKSLHMVITICEFFSIFVFLFVLQMYENPNVYIQTMGIMVIILLVFMIPNRWRNMLFVSTLGVMGYVICLCFTVPDLALLELLATIVYLGIIVTISLVSSWNVEKHQMHEFESKKKMERLSSTDYLTNASSRFKLQKEADRWINFCYSQGLPLSLVFIDVDNLKQINDRHGHLIGDSVLSDLVLLIHRQQRTTDILARWGGDEFVMLLPNTSLDNAIVSTERIRKIIEEYVFAKEVKITCSFGIVQMKEGSTFESLIRESDKRMYEGKKCGKNNIQWENGAEKKNG